MNPLFQVHRLNENGIKMAQLIAEAFNECVERIELLCPPGRELAIVKTKLEEAAFFAKKAMANKIENQA